ncbi:MaoC family dehydratase [Hoyosella altamirensis]|uniref:Acyl dehydratase n=1 Tax=Hoyosella altamirensis TaxID=616997 RepID=A0A839RMS9_9ACTN|nr:MaoC family dehydratase [Hoyosella altamirensis]MBB3038252.1 acyl dehydratase [Hoyosella altamirensis]
MTTMNAPRVLRGVDSVEAAVGEHLGYSQWEKISQERVNRFADATGDHQWIHVDPERAAQGPFGGTIAHGYLTLSLIPALARQVVVFEGFAMVINYGSNKVRFPQPVKVGAMVRVGAKITAVERTVKGAQVTVRYTVEIEGADKPACTTDEVRVLVA